MAYAKSTVSTFSSSNQSGRLVA